MPRLLTALATAAALALPTLATAQDMNPNVAARHAVMDVLAYNLGQIGGMAQGRMPYDAAVASTAANNIYHLAMLDIGPMFPEGTDNASTDGSRALPAIWSDMDGFNARWAALQTAAEAMKDAAGTDLASLQGAMGGLGGACGACHQTYRQPQ